MSNELKDYNELKKAKTNYRIVRYDGKYRVEVLDKPIGFWYIVASNIVSLKEAVKFCEKYDDTFPSDETMEERIKTIEAKIEQCAQKRMAMVEPSELIPKWRFAFSCIGNDGKAPMEDQYILHDGYIIKVPKDSTIAYSISFEELNRLPTDERPIP